MYELRLGEADRERFGITDEWLQLNLNALLMHEAEILDEHGIDVDAWPSSLNGSPRLDAKGKPAKDADGDPIYRRPIYFWRVLVWLALTRAGKDLPYETGKGAWTFDKEAVVLRRLSEPEVTGGKGDPDPAPASES